MSGQVREFPRWGRLAGVDFGTVRIGISMCDQSQSIASPYENYQVRHEAADAEYFRQFVRREAIVGIVVGLPVHLSGNESSKSQQARRFAAWLEKVTGLPVTLFDERFTTAFAQDLLAQSGLTKKQRKKRIDQLAAQILLTAFLESQRDSAPNHNQGIDD